MIRQGPLAAAQRFGIVCSLANSRPWLDGSLDDPLWQNSNVGNSVLKLASQQSNNDGEIQFGADDEFLFVAGKFPRLAGVTYWPATSTRTRNADLSASDRITIRLDTDRDYRTCFQFSIDSSGQVHDECGLVVAWDPQWFVACRLDDANWYFEAAIPLKELCEPGCCPLWSVSASRYVRDAQAATWWQSDFGEGVTRPAARKLAVIADGDESDLIHPDAWAMIQMPWESASPESAKAATSPALPMSSENEASIRDLPAIR